MPECTVIPVLSYPDVAQAIDWLSQAFGFSLRLKIGDHRAQFAIGDGSIVITKERTAIARIKGSVMVRVERVDFLPESPTVPSSVAVQWTVSDGPSLESANPLPDQSSIAIVSSRSETRRFPNASTARLRQVVLLNAD